MKRLLMLLLTLGLVAGAAYAHEGMQHVMGIVTVITDTSVTVKATNGTTKTVVLTAKTKYSKGNSPVNMKEIKVGDQIVVHAARKNGQLTASEVKLGATKSMKGDMSGMKMDGGEMTPAK